MTLEHLNPPDRALDAVVIAPHPDDAELGLAGTILNLQADGLRVGILDLTSGEPTPHGSLEIRAAETAAATKVLGVAWRGNLGLPNRSLEPTLENRKLLASALRLLRPRLLFAPYWIDSHPDHVAATQLIENARFWCKLSKTDMPGTPYLPGRILYYFCVHLRLALEPAMLVDISPYWDQKQAAIECFRSQFLTGRPAGQPTVVDMVRDQNKHWGWLAGCRYAEPLFTREPLSFGSLRDLAVGGPLKEVLKQPEA